MDEISNVMQIAIHPDTFYVAAPDFDPVAQAARVVDAVAYMILEVVVGDSASHYLLVLV